MQLLDLRAFGTSSQLMDLRATRVASQGREGLERELGEQRKTWALQVENEIKKSTLASWADQVLVCTMVRVIVPVLKSECAEQHFRRQSREQEGAARAKSCTIGSNRE